MEIVTAEVINDQTIKCKSPKSELINQNIKIQISLNKIDWADKVHPYEFFQSLC